MDLTREKFQAQFSALDTRRPEYAGVLPTAWQTPEQRTWEEELFALIFGTRLVEEEA